MKEFIDKLISMLEEKKDNCEHNQKVFENKRSLRLATICEAKAEVYNDSIAIVNQLAEEYKCEDKTDYANIELYAFWKNHQWIPCSERLPEAGNERDVWISIENEVISYKAKWYLDHFEWDNGWAIKENILAWMPNDVPAPYTKGEAELYRAKSVDGEYQEYKGDWK